MLGNKPFPNKALLSLEMQMNLDTLRSVLPQIVEQQVINAQIHKARFDALLKEGFTEKQALEIVKTRPLFE